MLNLIFTVSSSDLHILHGAAKSQRLNLAFALVNNNTKFYLSLRLLTTYNINKK